MENEKVDTCLPGYEGPYFTQVLTVHEILYGKNGEPEWKYAGHELEKLLSNTIDEFDRIGTVFTDDGYSWFWGLYFTLPGCEIVIALPWRTTWDPLLRKKGVCDRHTAAYMRGEQLRPSALSELSTRIAQVLSQDLDERTETATNKS